MPASAPRRRRRSSPRRASRRRAARLWRPNSWRQTIARDKLVDVVEGLVVTHVDHHAAITGQRDGHTFVLETTQRGALDGCLCRLPRIDFDDPAKTIGLVGHSRHVETAVVFVLLLLVGSSAIGMLRSQGLAKAAIIAPAQRPTGACVEAFGSCYYAVRCRSTYSRKASSMRVCQPSPVALKYSRTSRL